MIRRLLLALLVLTLIVAIAGSAIAYWFFSGDGVRVALEQQASRWLGQPVTIQRASAQIFPRASVNLRDVRVGEPTRVILADVQLSTDLRALLRRTIEDATVTVSNSRIDMPLSLPSSGGESTGSEAASNSTVRIVSIRGIALHNIDIVSRGRTVRVSADSTLTGTKLTVHRFSAQSGKTTLDAEGEVELEPRIDARVRAKANKLDVDELVALADAFTPPASAGAARRSAAPARIAARVSADTATAGSVNVKQFATDLEMVGDQVSLSPLTFQLFGGRYQGSLTATLGKAMSVASRSRIENLDVASLAAFGGAPDTVTGTLTGAASFAGQGADISGVLRTARGMGTAAIASGTIRRLNLVRTVVLFFGRPAPDTNKEGTDRFDRIDSTFSLADRIVHADSFALRSPDADIVGAGTLNISTQGLDGTLDLSLSEELSKQAGTDLVRYTREGNRVVLPAKISGTISQPRIFIDASAAVKRGLRNEVQRRLKGVFDRFTGPAPSN